MAFKDIYYDSDADELVVVDDDGSPAALRSGSLTTEELNTVQHISTDDLPQDIIDEHGSNTVYVFETGEWVVESDDPSPYIDVSDLSNVALIGQNRTSTIDWNERFSGNSLIRAFDAENVIVSGFHLKGSPGYTEVGVDIRATDNAIVDNNWSEDNYDGILIADGSNDAVISNNYIERAIDDGINPGGQIGDEEPCHRIIVYGNTVLNAEETGIHWSRAAKYGSTIGNTVVGCERNGIDFNCDGSHVISGNVVEDCNRGIQDRNSDSEWLIISNNIIDGMESQGIRMEEASGRIITSNIVRNTVGRGIDASGVQKILVSNNMIEGLDQDGIRIGTSSSSHRDYIITGNQIENLGSGGHGILADMANEDHDIVISANQVRNAGSRGIFVNDANDVVVTGNIATNSGVDDLDINGADVWCESNKVGSISRDVRTIHNGRSENEGDPNSAGDWNGQGSLADERNVIVEDTSNDNLYMSVGGSFVQIN